MKQVNLNSTNQTATMVVDGEIKTLGYDQIKLSELVNFDVKPSDTASFEKFTEYHNSHPWVMHWLKRRALRLKNKGLDKVSMKGLFEVVRIGYAMSTGNSPRKLGLSNNYTPFYARALMKIEPRLYDFFEIREQKATKEIQQ